MIKLINLLQEMLLQEAPATIKNPATGRTIKVSSALTYPKDSAVYKAAAKMKPGAVKALAMKSKNIATKQAATKPSNTKIVHSKKNDPDFEINKPAKKDVAKQKIEKKDQIKTTKNLKFEGQTIPAGSVGKVVDKWMTFGSNQDMYTVDFGGKLGKFDFNERTMKMYSQKHK